MKIRKDDTVIIITGKDKGKKGKIRQVLAKDGSVVIEGINIIKRHKKPRGQARQAGIIESEAPVNISKVMIMCPKCSKPVRLKAKVQEDGKRMRVCSKCNEVIS
jgi:large subunit ribosomal protein L24